MNQKHVVKKTFIELAEDDNSSSDAEGGKRSHSDTEVLLSEVSSGNNYCTQHKGDTINDLQTWHRTWSSSSSSRSQQADTTPSTDQKDRQTTKIFLSSSSSSRSRQEGTPPHRSRCPGVSDQNDVEQASEFDFDGAVKLAEELHEAVDLGVDIRDAIAKSYPDLDFRKVIPRDQKGEALSIGSVWHLLQPLGTHCRPCGYFRKGTCDRSHHCLYCHFDHEDSRFGIIEKNTRPGVKAISKSKARRNRKKLADAKNAALKRPTRREFDDDLGHVDRDGSDNDAYDDDQWQRQQFRQMLCDEVQDLGNSMASSSSQAPQTSHQAPHPEFRFKEGYKISL